MKIIFGIFIVIALITSSCSSAVETENRSRLIWKATIGNSEMYIMGSIKYFNFNPFLADSFYLNIYNQCDEIALEFDKSRLEELEKLQVSGVYSDASTLEDSLSQGNYQMLVQKLKEHGISQSKVIKIKPWLAVITLEALELKKMGFSAKFLPENIVTDKSKSDGRYVNQLETFDFRYRILYNDWLKGYADEFTEYSLDRLKFALENSEKLNKAWIKADTNFLSAFYFSPALSDADLLPVTDNMFTKRNKYILNRMTDFKETEKKYFIVLDLGHLLGSGSLIELLRSDPRFTVEQM